jgi:glutamate-1-semialdehyde aminotransferase
MAARPEAQIELAQTLCERPSIERVRFCNSGTPSNLVRLRTLIAAAT